MNIAIVTAAGQGRRFGGKKPLQLLKNRPLLAWAVRNFERAETIREIIVTFPADDTEEPYRTICAAEKFQKVRFVPGGETRSISVRNAFESIQNDRGVVLIHDAARPLVSMEVIQKVLKAAENYGAAIPVLPVLETVKEVEGNRVMRTIPREKLFLAQTPQGFRVELLREAYSKMKDQSVTDEAMLVEMAGHTVHVVDGDPKNMKITTNLDLSFAEYCL